MEDYLQYKIFSIKELITEKVANELLLKSVSTVGIDKLRSAGQIVSFIYNPYEISEQEIIDWLLTFVLSVKRIKLIGLKEGLPNWQKAIEKL